MKALPVVIIDTREQLPWEFPTLPTTRAGLDFGDYSVRGLEHVVAIERKSLQDYVTTVTVEHYRFSRECDRAEAVGARLVVVVEASREDVLNHAYEGTRTPAMILGAERALALRGVPTIWSGSRSRARDECEAILRKVWERARLSSCLSANESRTTGATETCTPPASTATQTGSASPRKRSTEPLPAVRPTACA